VVSLRSCTRACWIVSVAFALSFALQPRAASAAPVNAMTTTAVFNFSFPTQAFPCPLSCGGLATGTFEGTVSGLDVSNRPFTATFAATGINMTGPASNTEGCTGDPSGELIGTGNVNPTVTGGTLIDNGVVSTGASLIFTMDWWQYGTTLVLFQPELKLRDGSGAAVQTSLLGGNGVGKLIPVWNPLGVPLSCFDQWPATLIVTGSFAAPL